MSGPLTRRLAVLRDNVRELRARADLDAASLAGDPTVRAAIERWLQVAIEACIDGAHHVIAASGWTPPTTARDAFAVLAAHGALDGALALRLGRAAGLRNILVHDYVSIDLETLATILKSDVDDLAAFADVLAAWAAARP